MAYFGVVLVVLVVLLVLVVTGVKQSQLLVLGLEFDNKWFPVMCNLVISGGFSTSLGDGLPLSITPHTKI